MKQQEKTSDKQRGVWEWLEVVKGERWETPLIPDGDASIATVKRGASKDVDGKWYYYAYRNGRIMGKRPSAEAAMTQAESGKFDPRDDAVALYAKNHSGDIPMFLRLTEKEREQVRKHFKYDAPAPSKLAAFERPTGRGLTSAADVSDPGTAKVLAARDATPQTEKVQPVAKPTKEERKEVRKFADNGKMSRAKAGNPKKPGTAAYKRWELMFKHCDKGSTVKAFVAAGGNVETLTNAVLKGYAVVK